MYGIPNNYYYAFKLNHLVGADTNARSCMHVHILVPTATSGRDIYRYMRRHSYKLHALAIAGRRAIPSLDLCALAPGSAPTLNYSTLQHAVPTVLW